MRIQKSAPTTWKQYQRGLQALNGYGHKYGVDSQPAGSETTPSAPSLCDIVFSSTQSPTFPADVTPASEYYHPKRGLKWDDSDFKWLWSNDLSRDPRFKFKPQAKNITSEIADSTRLSQPAAEEVLRHSDAVTISVEADILDEQSKGSALSFSTLSGTDVIRESPAESAEIQTKVAYTTGTTEMNRLDLDVHLTNAHAYTDLQGIRQQESPLGEDCDEVCQKGSETSMRILHGQDVSKPDLFSLDSSANDHISFSRNHSKQVPDDKLDGDIGLPEAPGRTVPVISEEHDTQEQETTSSEPKCLPNPTRQDSNVISDHASPPAHPDLSSDNPKNNVYESDDCDEMSFVSTDPQQLSVTYEQEVEQPGTPPSLLVTTPNAPCLPAHTLDLPTSITPCPCPSVSPPSRLDGNNSKLEAIDHVSENELKSVSPKSGDTVADAQDDDKAKYAHSEPACVEPPIEAKGPQGEYRLNEDTNVTKSPAPRCQPNKPLLSPNNSPPTPTSPKIHADLTNQAASSTTSDIDSSMPPPNDTSCCATATTTITAPSSPPPNPSSPITSVPKAAAQRPTGGILLKNLANPIITPPKLRAQAQTHPNAVGRPRKSSSITRPTTSPAVTRRASLSKAKGEGGEGRKVKSGRVEKLLKSRGEKKQGSARNGDGVEENRLKKRGRRSSMNGIVEREPVKKPRRSGRVSGEGAKK